MLFALFDETRKMTNLVLRNGEKYWNIKKIRILSVIQEIQMNARRNNGIVNIMANE